MDIRLNFINRSNDPNNSDVVIFQKNAAPDDAETAIAWHVIHGCSRGNNHPFVFTPVLHVSARDAFGNHTPQIATLTGGQSFAAIVTPSGNRLARLEEGAELADIEVLNALPDGKIDACVFRGGNLLAVAKSIREQTAALFKFPPTIWIGAVSEVAEGDVMTSAVLSTVNAELSLYGVASADIVMTGGGTGKGAEPLQFTLQNVQAA